MSQEKALQENIYDFISPSHIVFGWGRRREIGSLGSCLGKKAIWIQGSQTLTRSGIADSMKKMLRSAGVEILGDISVTREPCVSDVDRATELIQQVLNIGEKPEQSFEEWAAKVKEKTADVFVVALGGGSAIDMGKAVAAMTVNSRNQSVQLFLEGVGTGENLTVAPLPVLAIPTTAGTGAEATRNAVISSDPVDHDTETGGISVPAVSPNASTDGSLKFKKSLRHNGLMPQIALVDPELTVSCSASVTACCGMDAMTQLVESFISNRAKPIPQALAIQGMGLIWNSLEVAIASPKNQDAREQLSHAALLSGMCLANSGLGMAHGIAAALGIHANVPHGRACGCLLPIALETNKQKSMSELSVLANFLLPPSRNYGVARVDEFIQRIKSIQRNIGIEEKLSSLGVTQEQIPLIAQDSKGNSMNGNPRTLSEQEIIEILEKSM